jgi:hypothetical protein
LELLHRKKKWTRYLDMPRKLKTYQTSQGFYDLAVAAPSIKTALEAWGASSNLFHQGFAKEVDDEEIVAATMEKPGVVLQRPVGSTEAFREHSGLPTLESLGSPAHKTKEPLQKKKQLSKATKTGEKQARKAALAFEQERLRREKQRQKEEAAAARIRARRQAAMEKAEAALESAKQEHEAVVAGIDKDRAAVDRRADEEQTLWEKVRERLRAALREAGE